MKNERDNMEDSVLGTYVSEIASQAEAAQLALQNIAYYKDKNPRYTISASIALLGATAIISKIMSGDTPPALRPGATPAQQLEHENQVQFAKDRGKAVRAVYKRGQKKTEVLNARGVRNGFEHVDHRLDRYHLDTNKKSLIRRSLVNGLNNVFGDDLTDVVFLGVVDYKDNTIVVMDDSISITKLEVAVKFVLERSAEWEQQHGGSSAPQGESDS